MPIELTIEQDHEHFAEFHFLPDVYNDEAYHGNDEIYILSADGYRFRVELVRAQCGPCYLTGPKWTAFCNRSLNEDVELLHFVEEGEDCFYVTGYLENGHEVGGYGGIRSGLSRFKGIVLADPRLPQALPAEILPGLEELDEITLEADGEEYPCHVRRVRVLEEVGSFKYQLLGDAWNTLVDDLGLEPGITVVYTKSPGHRLWVDAFEDDGSMITEFIFKGTTTLRRVQLPLEWHEEKDDRLKHICFWPFHRDHFAEYDRVFYKEYAQIQCYNRLAVPAFFLDRHPMHMYNKALIILGNYRVEMKIRMEPHRENPSRTNHVNVHGLWRKLAEVNHFPYTKVIRFRYMSNGEDLEAPAGQNPQFPIFHIC